MINSYEPNYNTLLERNLTCGGNPLMDITENDEGKTVVNEAGETVGMVSKVEGHNVHVNPDPGLTDSIKSKLGWGDADEDTHAIDQSDIASVTDDEVQLKR